MSIITKTTGELIDSLITVNIRIWMEIEKEIDETLSMEERFNAGQTVLKLNAKRKRLINGIDALEDKFVKTYYKDDDIEKEF